MTAALVGSVGAVATAASNTAVTPGWGTGESRTANNLLICWCDGHGSATLPTTPSGWSVLEQYAGGSWSTTTFYRVATGGDAAPTIAAATSTTWIAQLAEFSGCATSSPVDQTGVGTAGTSSPIVATAGGTDAASGELIVYSCHAQYSVSSTPTNTPTLNNGATAQDTNNNSTSASFHYNFGYGITTGHSSADTNSFAFTTTSLTQANCTVGSFKLAAGGVITPNRPTVIAQAVTRAAVW